MIREQGRRAFTLIELLVVIAIIGVLIALLLPAVQAAREAARRSQCTNNLKQLGIAVHNYIDSNQVLPAYCYNDNIYWRSSWVVAILPSMEQQPLYNSINLSQEMTARANTTLNSTKISTLLCPSDPQKQRPAASNGADYQWGPITYSGNQGGPGSIRRATGTIVPGATRQGSPALPFGVQAPVGLESITDGTSSTGLFSEKLLGVAGYPQVPISDTLDSLRTMYPAGVALTPDANSPAATLSFVNSCKALPPTTTASSGLSGHAWLIAGPLQPFISGYHHFGAPNTHSCVASNTEDASWGGTFPEINPTSSHPSGVNLGMADGSVKFIKDSIALPTWWALGTRNGREAVSAGDY